MSRARTILFSLIASGDTDPSVYLWAGHLVEHLESNPQNTCARAMLALAEQDSI